MNCVGYDRLLFCEQNLEHGAEAHTINEVWRTVCATGYEQCASTLQTEDRLSYAPDVLRVVYSVPVDRIFVVEQKQRLY